MADFEEVPAAPCLNFPVNMQSLPLKGLELELQADEKERAALARAHGLAAVRCFAVSFQLRRWKQRGAALSGHISAVIEQQCVITAEPVENRIDERFEAHFIPRDSRLAKQPEGELFLDPEGADAPEVFSGGSLNIGAVAEEFFELAIDPYPRKKGAVLPAAADAESKAAAAAAEKPVSPFAALKRLKK